MKPITSSWLTFAVISLLPIFSLADDVQGDDVQADDVSPLQYPPLPPLEGEYVAPETPKYNYAEVLHKSYLFYHAQKSGYLPYQRLAWRSDSCKVCVGEFGEDLSRAWYEAANTMKWGLPLGWTITQLAFNIMVFEESMNSVDELAEGLELLRWGGDYLMNAHHNDTHIVGQLGTSAIGPISKIIEIDVDFNYWGPPEEYEEWVPTGLPHKAHYITPDNPGSEIVGEYGAALAAISIIWRKHDPEYADRCLDHARRLFQFATEHQGSYVTSRKNAFQWATFWYPSSHYEDELAWNAAWLYAATQEQVYLEEAKKYYMMGQEYWYEYSWDEKGGALHTLLYILTKDGMFYKNAMSYFNQFLPNPMQVVKYTPRGLAYIEHWGSVGYSGNVAFLMMAFAKHVGYVTDEAKAMSRFAIQQINYALGDYGYSWVVGFGQNYPTKPYHKSSYNSYIHYPMRGEFQDRVEADFTDSKTDQTFILYGAVEGGPNIDDSWHDDRSNYEYSEVTQDYNAAWTGAIAGLIDWYGHQNFEPYTDCGLDLGWSHPNASAPPVWPQDDCYHTCNTGCPRGQMQSSYSWKILMERITELPDKMEAMYPGQGIQKAAALEGTTVEELKLKINDQLEAEGKPPRYLDEEVEQNISSPSTSSAAGLRLKPTLLSLSVVASIFYWIC